MKRLILSGLFLLVLILSFSLLYIVKNYLSDVKLMEVLKDLDYLYLFLSFLFMFLYHTFDNLRLFIIAKELGIRYSLLYGYIISLINTFGATLTPAHLGGELSSLYLLSRKRGRFHKVMGIVTLKTITGSFFFLLAVPFLIFFGLRDETFKEEFLKVFLSSLLLLFLSLALMALLKRNYKSLISVSLRRRVKAYLLVMFFFLRKHPKAFLGATLFSILLYFSFLLSGGFLLKSFSPKTDLLKVLRDQVILLYAIFISPTPGGSGVGEFGGLVVFRKFLTLEKLGVFVILWRFITQYLSSLFGAFFFLLILLRDLFKGK